MSNPRTVHTLKLADVGDLPAEQIVGLIDEDAVTCLMVRIEAEGLLNPIWVRRNGNAGKPRWSVIAGRHRLRAVARLGRAEIEAVEYAGPTSGAGELRRLQSAENLDRRVLRPIERAIHIMDRWRAAAELIVPSIAANQQSKAVRARWSVSATVANTPAGEMGAVDEATAAACAVSKRKVETYRKLHANLVLALPDQFAQLNAHPLGESLAAMNRLAALKPNSRGKAAEVILSRPDWASMDEVLIAAKLGGGTGNRSTLTTAERFGRAWGALPLVAQQDAFVDLLKRSDPAVRAFMRAAIDRAEAGEPMEARDGE